MLRRLKLGQMLDTLPERLTLARQGPLPHADFLEMVLTAFGRQARGPPVRLAGHVVVHFDVAERFEPPRGPRAQVSQGVPAVNDDWAAPIQGPLSHVTVQGLKWHMDRAGQVLFVELLSGQDLDQLRASLDQALHLLPANRRRHKALSDPLRAWWAWRSGPDGDIATSPPTRPGQLRRGPAAKCAGRARRS